jgi:hypothetical protein
MSKDEPSPKRPGRTQSRHRNAVRRALEEAARQLEAFDRAITGAEAAAVVRAAFTNDQRGANE